jgi:hypothetical protein
MLIRTLVPPFEHALFDPIDLDCCNSLSMSSQTIHATPTSQEYGQGGNAFAAWLHQFRLRCYSNSIPPTSYEYEIRIRRERVCSVVSSILASLLLRQHPYRAPSYNESPLPQDMRRSRQLTGSSNAAPQPHTTRP